MKSPKILTERTQAEIDELLLELDKYNDRSKYPGMTYEQGIRNCLDWLMDEEFERPME